MAENNTQNPKPDWIASVVTGALKDTQQLYADNKKAEEFEFNSNPDVYWSTPVIKQQFQNDKAAFDEFYKQQKKVYDGAIDIDKQFDGVINVNYPSSYAKSLGRALINTSRTSEVISDPEGRSVFGTMSSEPRWTLHSLANERGVKTPSGFMPIDKYEGKTRYARNKDGSWKFDENNLPYIEPYNEETDEWRSFDEEYSSVANWAGAYGLKNESYVTRPIYGLYAEAVNFMGTTANALSEYIRVLSDMGDKTVGYAFNDENFKGDLTKALESFQTAASSQVLPSAEYSNRMDPWTFSNIASMGTQAALQLVSMRGVAGLAGKLTNSSKFASTASKMYMTGMSAGHVADISREHDLNPYETGALLALTSIPYYYISSLSESAIGLTRPLMLRQAVPDMLKKQFDITIAKNGFNAASMSSYVAGLKSGIAHVANNLEAFPLAKSITLESTEEVAEEIASNGILSLYDRVYKADTFNVDWSKIMSENIPLSAVGGAIGGGIAYKMLKKMGAVDPQAIETMEDAAVRGEMWRFYSIWDKMEKNGEFDKDPVKNAQTANFLRSVGQSIEEVWEKSGLKKAIHNNEVLAKQLGFEQVLKTTKIGQDLKEQVAKLQVAKEKLTSLSQQLADNDSQTIKDDIIKTQSLIDSINKENESISQGKSVRRWITEGLYNIRYNNNLGGLIAKANIESSSAKQISDKQVEDRSNKIAENNKNIDVTNFESLEITEAGLLNLRQSFVNYFKDFVAKRENAFNKLRATLSTISGAENDFDNLLSETNPEKVKDIILDDILGYVEAFKNQDFKFDEESENLIAELEQMTSSNGLISRVINKKSIPSDSIGEDRHMLTMYDAENNTTTGLIEDILANEELISKNGENEDYISSVPSDIISAIELRARQIQSTVDFAKEDAFIKPPVKDAEAAFQALDAYMARAIKLRDSARKNAENTESAVRDIYFKKGDERVSGVLDVMEQIAKTQLFPDFLEINATITEKANNVKQAILNKDLSTFNNAMMDFEVSVYKTFVSKRNEVLDVILNHVNKDYKYSDPETDKIKRTYDFIRGVTAEHPAKVYNLYADALHSLSDQGNAPTAEQKSVIIDSFRSMIAGRYKWATYGVQVQTPHFLLNFTAGVDGGSGTGKTSTVIPVLAQMANRFFSKESMNSKVIFTSAADELGERRKNLMNGFVKFAGSKPEWLTDSAETLVNIIKGATEDTNLVVYDEATLLSTSQIDEINNTLNQVNVARVKAGKTPLHLLYTYDRYQNSAKDKASNMPTSITALRVNLPTTPRLTFSFRSQNKALKIYEDYIRLNSNSKGKNLNKTVFSFDNKNGVLVINNRAEFEKVAGNYIETLTRDNEKENLVYITTDESTKPFSAINDFGVKRLTSEQAQGREWDYVILDDKDGNIFADVNKAAQYYTGGTRARKGMIVFVSPDIPMETVRGTVTQYTPLRPAAVSKADAIQEILNFTSAFKNEAELRTGYSPKFANPSVASTVASSTNFNTPPPISASDEPYYPEDYNPAIPETPFEYGPLAIPGNAQDVETIRKVIFGSLKEKVMISTFFTPTGTDRVLKKNLIYNDSIKREAKYYITIAPIGSPGYDNVINPSSEFDGKYGVFIEGEHKGKRAVIGTLQDMDEEIRKSGIQKFFVDGMVQIPVSSAIITGGVNLYPQIINELKTPTGVKKRDVTTRKTLNEVRRGPHGLSVSRVLVATSDIVGYNANDDNPRVPKGTPFVVISYKHSKEELDNLLAKGVLNLTPSKDRDSRFMDITVLGLDRTRRIFTRDEVYSIMKNFIFTTKQKTIGIDFNKEINGIKNAYFNLRRLFWTEPLQDKAAKDKESGVYKVEYKSERWRNIFKQAYQVGLADPNVKSFIEKMTALQSVRFQKKGKKSTDVVRVQDGFNWTELFDHWIQSSYQKENPTAPKSYTLDEIDAIDKLMTIIFNTEEMRGGFFFDVPAKRGSTSAAARSSYMFAEDMPSPTGTGSIYDSELTANYLALTPPKIVINPNSVTAAIKTITTPSTSTIVDSGLDEQLNETASKPNLIKKLSISSFINNEFPDNALGALKALKTFRADLMNSRLNLKGIPPTIVELNTALITMKSAYANPASVDGKVNSEIIAMYAALERNFDGLLGNYAPDVAFNPDTKEYYLQRGNKKSGAFQAKEELSLFDDGMNNIVKSYLFNTTKVAKGGDGKIFEQRDRDKTPKFISKRDIQRIAPLFENDDNFLEKLKNSSDDAALTLYVKFFSKEKNGDYSSMSMIDDENAFHLVTAIRQFLKGAEEYLPAYSKKTFNKESYSTEYQYPLSGGRPDAMRSSMLDTFGQYIKKLFYSKSLQFIPASEGISEKVIVNGKSISKVDSKNRDSITDEQVLVVLKDILGESYEIDNLRSFLNSKIDKSKSQYRQDILDYYYNSLKKYSSSKETPSMAGKTVIDDVISSYADDNNLNHQSTFIAADGSRQYIMRQTSPIMRLENEIAYLRDRIIQGNPEHLLSENLLANPSSNYFLQTGIKPFNHQGVSIKSATRDTAKPLSDMDESELLEIYLVDGFANSVAKNSTVSYFPVTVYADAGTEIEIPFGSTNWMRPSNEIIDDVFNSRVDYFTKLEAQILEKYNSTFGFGARSINELNAKLMVAKITPEVIESKDGFITNLYYEKTKAGNVLVKQSLVDEINLYRPDASNRKAFATKMQANVEQLLNYSKSDASENSYGENLLTQVKKVMRDTPHNAEAVIEAYYLNWLAITDSFQKLQLGAMQQYKSDVSKQMIEMVKRSKLLISPGTPFIYRLSAWREQFDRFKSQGVNPPRRLKWEGKKLNAMSRIAVIEDPISLIMELDNGGYSEQKIWDGATFVNPITRLMQSYSSGRGYGITVDAVMKNATKSSDYDRGINKVVKNAEFEITPEIMRRGTPLVLRMVRAMFNQQFDETIVLKDGTQINNALDFLRSYGVDVNTFSNVDRSHFVKLLDDLVEYGVQDFVIQELIPPSSMKTGVENINKLDSETYRVQYLDIRNKVMQQDAIKDPTRGLDTKVLTQAVQAIAINWKEPELLENFYTTLSEITREFVDEYATKTPQDLDKEIKKLIEQELTDKEEFNYRTEAVAQNFVSMNDRMMSGLFTEKLASKVKKNAVAFNLRGGHYIVHPTSGLIELHDVTDTKTGKTFTVFKDQLGKYTNAVSLPTALSLDSENMQNNVGLILEAKESDSIMNKGQRVIVDYNSVLGEEYKKQGLSSDNALRLILEQDWNKPADRRVHPFSNMGISQINKFFNIVGRVESQVSQPQVSDKKADIERRRQEAIEGIQTMEELGLIAPVGKEGFYYADAFGIDPEESDLDSFKGKTKQEVIDKINAKYDAELAALEGAKPAEAPKAPVTAQQVGTRYIISSPRTDLKYSDPKHIPTGLTLTQMYDNANNLKAADPSGNRTIPTVASNQEIAKIHSLLNNKTDWEPGEAEILLPMEMKFEFMLEDADAQKLAVSEIDENYFYTQITKGKEIDKIEPLEKAYRLRASLMYNSFQKRITGILGRIPTSGKHSILSTKVAGFMNESKNSVFIPSALLKIQGADQDIDKGSYLTYKTLVMYTLKHNGADKRLKTFDRDAYPDYHVVSEEPYAISLVTERDEADFYKAFPLLKLSKEDKKFITRHRRENALVDGINEIMKSSANIVEANVSVDKVLNPMRATKGEEVYNPDNLFDYLKIHRLNQAGGKSLTGIFANANKAYNVMYIVNKLTGLKINIAGLDESSANRIWEAYAALIGASVDNANENVLGPNGIDNVTAPYVAYLTSQGYSIQESKKLIEDNAGIFTEIRSAQRYDRKKAFNVDGYAKSNPEFYGLYKRVEEANILSRLLVNRDLPVAQEDYISFYSAINSYVNTKLGKKDFDLVQFLANPSSELNQEFIDEYEKQIILLENGEVSPESTSTFNILAIIANAPHIRQYVRSMSLVHSYSMRQKAYSAINYVTSKLGINDKVMTTPKVYREVSEFIHSSFVDSYLNNRKFNEGPSKITQHDLSEVEGRKKFVVEVREGLDKLKSRFKDNPFIQDLKVGDVIRNGSVTSQEIIKMPSFYEMNEDRKIILMASFRQLPIKVQTELFIYNLITTRDGSGAGSMSSLFSPAVKADYVNFLDSEIQPDNESLYISYKQYKERLNSELEQGIPSESDIIIPFGSRINVNKPLAISTEKYKDTGITVMKMPYIQGYGVSSAIDVVGTEKIIQYNPALIKAEYRNKAWMKQNWIVTRDGTKVQTLPSDLFKNDREYSNFILELNSLRLTNSAKNYVSDAQFIDEMMKKAAKNLFNKDILIKRTEADYEKEAKQCGLLTTNK